MSMRAALVYLALIVATPALADLDSAFVSYRKGDHAAAFKSFYELAELGQPIAQKDVAVMYMNGQGVEKNTALAYAWAMLAAENGEEDGRKLVAKLRPSLAAEDLAIAADLRARYGRAALDERLIPKIDEEKKPDPGSCMAIRPYIPAYPQEAQARGMYGTVVVEFAVMPDGRARMPRILHAIPLHVFDDAVRASVLRTKFTPGRFDGKTAPCMSTIYYRFEYGSDGSARNPKLNKYIVGIREKAEAGDTLSQMVYGMLLSGLPQLEKQRSDALPWFLKAAQAGAPLAQYQVGYGILKGWGCLCEEPKGLIWLRKAAEADQPDAQLTLAQYALRDASGVEGMGRAKTWLERAVAHHHDDSKLYLAALLAAAPSTEIRDPQRALALLEEVFTKVDDDPTSLQIRAAAQAAAGDFREAVSTQKRALTKARRLGWDIEPDTGRLALYEAQQPWFGNLLPF